MFTPTLWNIVFLYLDDYFGLLLPCMCYNDYHHLESDTQLSGSETELFCGHPEVKRLRQIDSF